MIRLALILLTTSLLGMRTHAFFEEYFEVSNDKTEYMAYKALTKHPFTANINFLAVPWSYLLDERLPFPRIKLQGGFTVCQHPDYELIIPHLINSGIDTLFAPFAKKKSYPGITVLPFPIFPLEKREGRISHQSRFYDQLATGNIPVLLTDKMLLPNCIPWDNCLIFLKSKHRMHFQKKLARIPKKRQGEIRARCGNICSRYLTEQNFARTIRDFYAERARYSMISYEVDQAGWLGTDLYKYIKAKWISHKYNIPFFYQPFQMSEELMVDTLEDHSAILFKHELPLTSISDFSPKSKSIYYIDHKYQDPDWDDPFEVCSWSELRHDAKFLAHIRKRLKPNAPGRQVRIPKNCATLAVHIKRGNIGKYPLFSEQTFSTYDKTQKGPSLDLPFADIKDPLRFPPLQFFIREIKSISQHESNRPLYVHIFTDAENPKDILNTVRDGVGLSNITYGIREEENSYADHIFDDLFALTQFEYLIRPRSSFSQIASLLADYKVIRYPVNAFWAGNRLIVVAN